jgi:uncharacterized protein YjbI with pentapeptide repeats
MADREHVDLLQESSAANDDMRNPLLRENPAVKVLRESIAANDDMAAWNLWRRENPGAEINLVGANLLEAVLRRANLSRAYLSVANLQEANLQEANLKGARLEGAHLNGANLQSAELSSANLRRANLTGANLTGASLKLAYLTNARLSEAHCERADLSGTDLRQATLHLTDFHQANLLAASLRSADLRQANLQGANLWAVDLRQANLQEANLNGADLRRANLQGANLVGARGIHLLSAWQVLQLVAITAGCSLALLLYALLDSALHWTVTLPWLSGGVGVLLLMGAFGLLLLDRLDEAKQGNPWAVRIVVRNSILSLVLFIAGVSHIYQALYMYLGGFAHAGTSYLSWLAYQLGWLVDILLFNVFDVYAIPVSPIRPQALWAQTVVFALNLILVAIVLGATFRAVNEMQT